MGGAKTMAVLGACILAAAGAHVFLSMQGMGDTIIRRSVLLGIDAQDADAVTVTRPGSPAIVLKKEDSWRLAEPFQAPADETAVRMLLDALTVEHLVGNPYTAQDFAAFDKTREDYGLGEGALRVEVSRGGAAAGSALFGVKTATGDGYFAAIEGDPDAYIVSTGAYAAVSAPADGFRMKKLFPGGAANADSFDLKKGVGSFMRFSRNGDSWEKAGAKDGDPGEPVSAALVAKFLSRLDAAEASGFVWPTGATNESPVATAPLLAGYGLDSDSAVTVTVRTRGRPDEQVSFGRDAGDSLAYVLAHGAETVATVPAELRDYAYKADFADSRLFAAERQSVSKVSVEEGGVKCLLAKDASGVWRMDAPVAAAADAAKVDALVARILALRVEDRDPSGVEVSLQDAGPSEKVSPKSLFGDMGLEDLRGREMMNVPPADVRRLTAAMGTMKPVAVVFDPDRRQWSVESADRPGTVVKASVEGALAALSPLKAEKVVKLKATAADLRRYGLETPRFTLAVDAAGDGAIRRNVMVGEKSQGGRFATIGPADSVFVISEAVFRKLSDPLVAE
jgi:hypothetical protein